MTSHYYSARQEGSFTPFSFSYHLRGDQFTFSSAAGVFSKDRVDRGTEILVTYMDVPEGAAVLDIGCGIGIVGIAAARSCKAQVTFVDTNQRALKLTRMNVEKNHVEAVGVFTSDLYSKVDGNFDVILSNPPQSAGKKVCFDLIEGAFEHLNPKGSLQLVARKNKGGEVLGKKMEEVFGNLEILAKKSGYWVYCSRKL